MNDIINDTSSNKVSGTLLTAKRSLVCCFPCKISDDDILFLKQVPVHPRDRLERKTKDEVKIVQQVPLHPGERLKRKRTLDNYNNLI